MDAVKAELHSTVWATVDFLMAVFGLSAVFFPALSGGNRLLGSPLDDATVTLVLGVLAVGGAYPFVAGDWSLGRLGDYIFAFSARAIAIGFAAMITIVAFDITFAGDDPTPQAVTMAVAYVLAYLFVFRDAPTS